MNRKFDIALIAAALAVAVPFGSAFAATVHKTTAPQSATVMPIVVSAEQGQFAANGAAAAEREIAIENAANSGHGAGGDGNGNSSN